MHQEIRKSKSVQMEKKSMVSLQFTVYTRENNHPLIGDNSFSPSQFYHTSQWRQSFHEADLLSSQRRRAILVLPVTAQPAEVFLTKHTKI